MNFWFDLYRTLRFATRLPLPILAREEADPIVTANAFAPAFAASGLVAGAVGGCVMGLAAALSASSLMAATLGVATLIMLTGALHEDGLADCADGIGGGRTRERKLEIMRDSAIGTYGVLALLLSVAVRILALSALIEMNVMLAVAALFVTQAFSRAVTMLMASQLPHARPDGAAARLGKPSTAAAFGALALAAVTTAPFFAVQLGLMAGAPLLFLALALALALMLGVSYAIGRAAQRHIGGQTGDVLGACQQLSDLVGLLVLSISVSMVF
jgi:adenosylcobinamide-GDP ribazoletransferase